MPVLSDSFEVFAASRVPSVGSPVTIVTSGEWDNPNGTGTRYFAEFFTLIVGASKYKAARRLWHNGGGIDAFQIDADTMRDEAKNEAEADLNVHVDTVYQEKGLTWLPDPVSLVQADQELLAQIRLRGLKSDVIDDIIERSMSKGLIEWLHQIDKIKPLVIGDATSEK